MSSNYTAVSTKNQPLVWMLDLSGELVETESYDAVKLAARDRDGKFAPKFEKPVTKRQAMNKLSKSAQRLSSAIDSMMDMENW